MTKLKENYVKVHHLFYSDVLDEDTVEKMWAMPVDIELGHYRLDSIPFYAKSLALGDIIEAKYDDSEKALVLEDIVEFSGHSTVQVVVMDISFLTDELREVFHKIGCLTEKQMDRYFAIDIPNDLDYKVVKKELIELQRKNIIDFGEACISEQHKS